MPYTVRSQCDRCRKGDDFFIGMWRAHMGVYICRDACKRITNVPLETGKCPGCGRAVRNSDLFDYADFIPYFNGQSLAPVEPGPVCPKCGRGQLSFQPTIHHSMLYVFAPAPGDWRGEYYLEKEIFGHALMAAAFELDITLGEAFGYFGLDVTDPKENRILPRMFRWWRAKKGLSTPIFMDIGIHLDVRLRDGGTLPASARDKAARDLFANALVSTSPGAFTTHIPPPSGPLPVVRRVVRPTEEGRSLLKRILAGRYERLNLESNDEDLDGIVASIVMRSDYIRIWIGELGEDPPQSEEHTQECHEKTITRYTRRLEGHLKKRQGTTTELSPELRAPIIQRKGYYVDMHPEAKYAGGPLAGTPVLYVGDIVDKLSTEIDGEGHLFLICRSDRCTAGVPYSSYLQPEAFQVYTHADVTWVDKKEAVWCASPEELERLRRFGVLGPVESKNNNETTLRECDREHLRRMKEEGRANFNGLTQKRPA